MDRPHGLRIISKYTRSYAPASPVGISCLIIRTYGNTWYVNSTAPLNPDSENPGLTDNIPGLAKRVCWLDGDRRGHAS